MTVQLVIKMDVLGVIKIQIEKPNYKIKEIMKNNNLNPN